MTGKAGGAFSREVQTFDTTIGWRFVNPLMSAQFGVDSMPETAQNVADEFQISRADQDIFAASSQERAARAQANGRLAREIVPVSMAQKRSHPIIVDRDEHPRATSLEALAKLKPIVARTAASPPVTPVASMMAQPRC